MSHMSINQMLQPSESSAASTTSTTNSSVDENKLTGKVKIFYTFKGSDTHCLCSFDMKLDDYQDRKWVSVPLKQCLLSVCSSSPDQLVNSNTAIYSANFEESQTVQNWSPLHDSKSNIIWEGHGLLSNILSDENSNSPSQVTGKIAADSSVLPASSNKYDCIIEVLIQLHPIHNSPVHKNLDQPQPPQQQQYLPPMRSIWNESMNNRYSPPPPHSSNTNLNSNNNNSPSIDHRSPEQHTRHNSSPRQQLHMLNFPAHHQQQQRDDHQRLSSFTPNQPGSREIMIKDDQHHKQVYPPALDSNWPGSRYEASSFDHEMIKRRKLSIHSPQTTAAAAAVADLRHYANSSSNNKKLMNRHSPSNNHLTSTTTSLMSTTPTTDTYYHQSRRKKRDTKPPNANDIRPFVEVERTKDGHYALPAEVDSWTVLSLGTVVYDRAAFHNQRYIYPVGYRVKKWYRSMVDPHSDTQYTCEILDGGDEPIFQLNADDNPSECWRGPTPTTVWTIAVRRAFAIRNMDYGHNPVGPDFFGLRKNTIAKMIQDLPNADKCKNYIWQNFEAMSNNKGKSIRRSNTRLSSSSSTGSTQHHSSALDDRLSTSPPTPTIKSEGL